MKGVLKNGNKNAMNQNLKRKRVPPSMPRLSMDATDDASVLLNVPPVKKRKVKIVNGVAVGSVSFVSDSKRRQSMAGYGGKKNGGRGSRKSVGGHLKPRSNLGKISANVAGMILINNRRKVKKNKN